MIGKAAELIAYAAARGVAVSEEEAPILLTKATDYLNTFSWIGNKPKGQEDSWPRRDFVFDGTPLFDVAGDPVTETTDDSGSTHTLAPGDMVYSPAATPQTIITAAYRVAMAIGDGADFQTITGGAKVVQESVSGAVSVTYAEGTVSDAVIIPGFNEMISDWLSGPLSTGINFNVMRG